MKTKDLKGLYEQTIGPLLGSVEHKHATYLTQLQRGNKENLFENIFW